MSKAEPLDYICLGAIEGLTEHRQLDTHTQATSQQFRLVGVLKSETFVGKETDGIVHELKTDTMIGFQCIERHVGCCVHRIRIVLITCHLDGIGTGDVQFRLLAYGSRIE